MNQNTLEFKFPRLTREARVFQKVVANGDAEFKAYIIRGGKAEEITLGMAALTEDEKNIILAGCLMNYWKK